MQAIDSQEPCYFLMKIHAYNNGRLVNLDTAVLAIYFRFRISKYSFLGLISIEIVLFFLFFFFRGEGGGGARGHTSFIILTYCYEFLKRKIVQVHCRLRNCLLNFSCTKAFCTGDQMMMSTK